MCWLLRAASCAAAVAEDAGIKFLNLCLPIPLLLELNRDREANGLVPLPNMVEW
jgi:hypothetical protein